MPNKDVNMKKSGKTATQLSRYKGGFSTIFFLFLPLLRESIIHPRNIRIKALITHEKAAPFQLEPGIIEVVIAIE